MSKTKPREFWVIGSREETGPLAASLQPFSRLESWEFQIHVIEKLAYDELLEEVGKLREKLNETDNWYGK